MDFLNYESGISCEMRGAMAAGRLKMTDEKISFKASRSGRREEIKADEIDLVNWQRLAGSWGIRVFTKDGELHRFAGFKEAERERLANFFKQTYKLEMLDRELSVKGWNWGTANFRGSALGFEVGSFDAFEIPLATVNQCIAGKNEVSMEFTLNDDAAVNLSELRFHIPASNTDGGDGQIDVFDPVESFKEQVLSKASVVTSTGDAIAIFRDVNCLSPRGRYDITLYPTSISLHGKTFDYKIPHSTVMRLFLLPHKDQRQMHFAINLDPPIKQGQTRYHYVVFMFLQDDEEEIELPFSEEVLRDKYEGKLEKEMSGPTYEILSKLLKVLISRKITVPGNFTGQSGTPAISCSHKAASGFLYPLERGFMFMYKPTLYIRFDEIRNVTFERSGGSTRSFDIQVRSQNDQVFTFSSIEKGEYDKLAAYLKSKKIDLKSTGKGAGTSGLDFNADDRVDHHLAHVQNSADELSNGSSEMSSDDEDFNPDGLEALSAREEYDSDPTTTSEESSEVEGSDEDADKRRKEKSNRRMERRLEKERNRERKEIRAIKSSTTTGGRRKTKSKLPGQPKKNMTAYFMWFCDARQKIKIENPELTVTELAKKSGEIWRELSEKTEWEEKAAKDKERYLAEYKKWLENGGQDMIDKAKKEKTAAKRAATKAAQGGGAEAAPKNEAGAGPSPKKSAHASTHGGTGAGFKSKEYIEDSDSSDAGGSLKSLDKEEDAKDESKEKKSSDDEMASDGGAGGGSGSERASSPAAGASDSD